MTTFWSADAPSAIPYSMTVTLLDDSGETVLRGDGPLSLVPSDQWEPGRTYADLRTLDLPCDLPAGDYQIGVGVYDWRDGARLPVTLADETIAPDDLAIVGNVEVE